MTPIIIVSQFPSEKEGHELATALITEHIAACVHILPKGCSIYLWEGKLTSHEEYQIQIKTIRAHISKVSMKIKEFCSYTCPEILLIPLEEENSGYTKWLIDQCTNKPFRHE
ncbi:divalent-cation tolerance protein CutA [Chlamydia sp. 17-3921]|uniref:divalent-cation tolerance protein CutA n=1 Tax=Chlamydia sp. 17-3921 TaxID=2675798 RepID=UPI001917C320|nr:divalent cation tolerance protein CutA [Chlamydia sp. 17-3921]